MHIDHESIDGVKCFSAAKGTIKGWYLKNFVTS
jgi:hypothetical protein